MAYFTIVGEGPSDVEAAKRLCDLTGHRSGPVHITNGKAKLDAQLAGYNNAASRTPWLILRDLNSDATCAPGLRSRLCPSPSRHLLLRIAVRSIESWLLADRENLARYLRTSQRHFPENPESVRDAKALLVEIASQSRRRDVVRDVVPMAGLSARVGRGYVSRMVEFINTDWDPIAASTRSESLRRCLEALRQVPV